MRTTFVTEQRRNKEEKRVEKKNERAVNSAKLKIGKKRRFEVPELTMLLQSVTAKIKKDKMKTG